MFVNFARCKVRARARARADERRAQTAAAISPPLTDCLLRDSPPLTDCLPRDAPRRRR